jgi:vancomycin resistance protein YoaR
LAVVAITYLLLVLTNGDIPRGTSVVGISLAGQSTDEAIETLSAETELAAAPVQVTAGTVGAELDPAQVGLAWDIPATVDSAAQPVWNPLLLIGGLFGGRAVDPVVTADPETMRLELESLAAEADQPVVEGSVQFADGEATAIEPKPGAKLDLDAAAEAVLAGYLRKQEPIELPMSEVPATISADEVQRALAEFAEPALAAPVTVVVAGRSVAVTPAQLSAALSVEAVDGRLEPRLDAEVLVAASPGLAEAESPATDAKIDVVSGAVVITPSKPGREFDTQKLAEVLLPVLTESGSARQVSAELTNFEANLTTAEARALGVVEEVSTYRTTYPYAAYRLTNIHRAADLIDGVLLLPGDTFSLNETVGERTEANGFAKGTIIKDGRFFEDYGGGVSQVATTTFNAMFFAGLEDVEHKPHSFYISRYPVGREATVAWPVVDLKFRNDSPYGVLVKTSYTDRSVTVSLWSTKVWDIESITGPRTDRKAPKTVYDPSDECLPQSPVDGFRVVVTRVFKKGEDEIKREDFKTTYRPADRVLCRAKPTPSASPSASPTATPSPLASPTVTPTPTPSP